MSNRVACIYLPSFPLQVHLRIEPRLAQAGAYLIASREQRPAVVACSRAAYDAGVRRGASVTQARVICPTLSVVQGREELYGAAAHGLGETLLTLSDTVEVEASELHQTIFVEVPRGVRGDSFGKSLLHHVSRQGYVARVGVADDRFTARIAAQTGKAEAKAQLSLDARTQPFAATCRVVPRGGSAAFLAPMPLQLLPISAELLHLLRSFGVKTLGEFAALPPPSNRNAWSSDLDLRAMAGGDDETHLRLMNFAGDISETLVCGADCEESDYSFPLRTLADRVAERLRGRARAAERVELRFVSDEDEESIELRVPPTVTGRALFAAIVDEQAANRSGPVRSITLTVLRETAADASELALFKHPAEARGRELAQSPIANTQTLLRDRRPHRRRSASQAPRSRRSTQSPQPAR